MGIIGVSLIVATIAYLCMNPQPFVKYLQSFWAQPAIEAPRPPADHDKDPRDGSRDGAQDAAPSKAERDRAAMPPPPAIARPGVAPTIAVGGGEDGQTTPKAGPSLRADAVPTFSLSSDLDDDEDGTAAGVPSFPAPFSAQRASGPSRPGPMAPPPRPAVPTLPPRTLPLPNRAGPLPDRGGPAGLAPPPTLTAKPTKPSRKVVLTPGHSPLDWARVSGPGADLRNVAPATPYLRVTPSVLKTMNGRRGRDAWTVLGGGRVYNITPYLPYHPGGEGELLRCAGKDGNKLFGEVHPWVNYDTMLSACLVGVMVDEHDERENKMEEMD